MSKVKESTLFVTSSYCENEYEYEQNMVHEITPQRPVFLHQIPFIYKLNSTPESASGTKSESGTSIALSLINIYTGETPWLSRKSLPQSGSSYSQRPTSCASLRSLQCTNRLWSQEEMIRFGEHATGSRFHNFSYLNAGPVLCTQKAFVQVLQLFN